MKKALKTKKTLKRLDRVDTLLSKIIDQYPADELGVRELLESARSSVSRAKAKAKPLAKKVKPAAKAKSAARAKAPLRAKTSRKKAKSARPGGTAKGLRKAITEDAISTQSPAEEMAAVTTL
jgi:hypothetical protein